MGQQPSRSHTPTSPNVTSSHTHDLHNHDPSHAYSNLRRKSIQALSTVKASAAPPSATFSSAAAQTSTSLRPHPHPPHPHSRARSQTTTASSNTNVSTAAAAHTLRAAQDTFKAAEHDRMGNEQSRQKGHARPPTPKAKTSEQKVYASPQTRPVDVPAVPREDATVSSSAHASSIEPADASLEGPTVPSSHYSRPPRLPLPIEEEPHTPGSPIISPADSASPIDHGEIEGALPRHSSMLSSTIADDEDLGDEYKSPQDQVTVPALIEWEGPGERVYVTGTFAGWNRKYKLHRNGPSKKKNAFSAYVHIHPGTHHLMFIVDNDMRTSEKLPTAVDYTNILVNYIEVSRAAVEAREAEAVAEKERKSDPVAIQDQHVSDGHPRSQVQPPTPELQPVKKPIPEPKPKVLPPSPKKYHSEIPRYLADLDAAEESHRFARANGAAGVLPQPPTLPMFLNKSILNGVTPMKDDSSVLIMPNHTVLNHLATSSIKDNILATSSTTRYKQKFLTTIMYKPRTEDVDQI